MDNSEIVKDLLQIFKKYQEVPNLEIEFRIGYIKESNGSSSFVSDISDIHFQKILKCLDESSYLKKVHKEYTDTYFKKESSDEAVDRSMTNTPDDNSNKGLYQIRKSSLESGIIVKTKLCTIDISFEPFDLRISFSTEEPYRGSRELGASDQIYVRNKVRDSFLYKHWSYDATRILKGPLASAGSSAGFSGPTSKNSFQELSIKKYEMELEIVTDISDKDDEFLEYLIESSLLKIRDLGLMCENDPNYNFKISKENYY
jgi:hypothetical protein